MRKRRKTESEKVKKMARPIMETPLLKDEDAERFIEKIAKNESKGISAEEYQRIKANFEEINKIKKFD